MDLFEVNFSLSLLQSDGARGSCIACWCCSREQNSRTHQLKHVKNTFPPRRNRKAEDLLLYTFTIKTSGWPFSIPRRSGCKFSANPTNSAQRSWNINSWDHAQRERVHFSCLLVFGSTFFARHYHWMPNLLHDALSQLMSQSPFNQVIESPHLIQFRLHLEIIHVQKDLKMKWE